MTQGKTLIIVLVTLIIGFGAGFVLRPIIVPVERTAIVAGPPRTRLGRIYHPVWWRPEHNLMPRQAQRCSRNRS